MNLRMMSGNEQSAIEALELFLDHESEKELKKAMDKIEININETECENK